MTQEFNQKFLKQLRFLLKLASMKLYHLTKEEWANSERHRLQYENK